jgi:hypothetical protein
MVAGAAAPCCRAAVGVVALPALARGRAAMSVRIAVGSGDARSAGGARGVGTAFTVFARRGPGAFSGVAIPRLTLSVALARAPEGQTPADHAAPGNAKVDREPGTARSVGLVPIRDAHAHAIVAAAEPAITIFRASLTQGATDAACLTTWSGGNALSAGTVGRGLARNGIGLPSRARAAATILGAASPIAFAGLSFGEARAAARGSSVLLRVAGSRAAAPVARAGATRGGVTLAAGISALGPAERSHAACYRCNRTGEGVRSARRPAVDVLEATSVQAVDGCATRRVVAAPVLHVDATLRSKAFGAWSAVAPFDRTSGLDDTRRAAALDDSRGASVAGGRRLVRAAAAAVVGTRWSRDGCVGALARPPFTGRRARLEARGASAPARQCLSPLARRCRRAGVRILARRGQQDGGEAPDDTPENGAHMYGKHGPARESIVA